MFAIIIGHARSERIAHILQPQGMPVRLEAGTFFDDGAIFAWVWRNSGREAVYPRLRVFVFDQRRRLVGGVRHCSAEPLQPGTRSRVAIVLDIKGATARDEFVAAIDEVASVKARWRLRESTARVIEIARGMSDFGSLEPKLAAQSVAPGPVPCACECEDAEASGLSTCGTAGLAAFTCTPIFPDGCTNSLTCR